MINDIEGKLKEISHRIKTKQQATIILTPQQKNLLKLKKIWGYIDTHHGPQYRDVYITNTSLPNYVQIMLNLLEMEERQIMSNSTSPLTSPHFQGIIHSNQAGILMEFMLDNSIFISFVDAALEDQPFGLLQVVIESFSHLCGELNSAFLTRHSVQRALNKLIYVTATTPKLNELYEDYLIELIFVLCQKMHENPSLVNFFIFPKRNPEPSIIDTIPHQKLSSYYFTSSTSSDSYLSPLSPKSPFHIINIFEKDYPKNEQSYEFFIFNYLMNYYFRAGNQGDYALTAISILIDLDIDLLYKFLLNNNFPLVITASLCGSYNALPTNRESGYLELNDEKDNSSFNTNKEFEEALKVKIDNEKKIFELKNRTFRGHIINDELNIFLRIFHFIQKITTDCKEPKMIDQFLYYFNEFFIKNILYNQFFTSKKVNAEEDYSRIFYLKLIINNLQSPALAQLFYKMVFPEIINEGGDNGSDIYLKKINAITDEYIKAMMEQDKIYDKPIEENENENENENEDKDKIKNEEDINKMIRKRLLSFSINERLENQLAINREIESTVTDDNYYKEKFKSIYEISPKIALHYAKESALTKFSTQQMDLASISQNADLIEESKNMYSYIISRLKDKSQGLRLVTLQLISIFLRKQNTVATHKLFPCYYNSSQDKREDGNNSSVDVKMESNDIDIKGIREDISGNKRKELETEYLKLFHCIHHFERLFQMNIDYLSRHLITNTNINPKDIQIENLQLNRYFNLLNSVELRNINSRIFIYTYILEASSSIQYNKNVDRAYASILLSPSSQKQSSLESEDSPIDVSSYVKIPTEIESLDSESNSGFTADNSAELLTKVLGKEKIDDILSIMKGFQNNQLLQCLFNYLRNWLDNPYEINLVVSGIFHQLLTSADHLFLIQYLIMNDQLLSKDDSESPTSLFTILQELVQKVNKNYNIIKTSTKINLLYLSMYEKLSEVNENIRLRGRSTYISLESAVDVSIICDYDDFLNAPMESEGAKEFEALIQTLDESGRQDLLNMFKLSTIKNIIILMEFLKDIIATLHVQFEQFALS